MGYWKWDLLGVPTSALDGVVRTIASWPNRQVLSLVPGSKNTSPLIFCHFCIFEHCQATGHNINPPNVNVLFDKNNTIKRRVKEAIAIKQRKPPEYGWGTGPTNLQSSQRWWSLSDSYEVFVSYLIFSLWVLEFSVLINDNNNNNNNNNNNKRRRRRKGQFKYLLVFTEIPKNDGTYIHTIQYL